LTGGELRYGKLVLIVGIGSLFFVGLTIYALFFDCDVWQKKSELFAVLGLLTGFGFGAIYSFAEYWLVRGHYDEQQISFYTPWTGHKKARWDQLESLEYNDGMAWYVMRFKSGKTIRVSSYMRGSSEMSRMVMKLRENVLI